MRESGGIAIMALLLMRLSTSFAQTSGPCERLVVEIDEQEETLEHETHSGRFYKVGAELDFKPLFRSEGDYLLQFIVDGDYCSTYASGEDSSEDVQPEDKSLEDSMDLENVSPRTDRRSLQDCGYWVIGKRDAQDCAMYPMIKVFDCADDPAMLEEDSKWFRQECNECDEEDVIGNVTIKFEEYACGSFTFAPTAAPTDEPEVAPSSVTTPVLPLSLPPTTPSTTTTTTTTTPSPVDANANDATTADGSGEDADEDADGDEDGDGVEAVPAGDGSGASKVGRLGVALGVAVSAVAVAANVVMNKM